MRNPIRRSAAAIAAGGAVAALSGLIAVPASATTVVPDDGAQLVRVELATLEPAAPVPGDRLEITGSITNVTDEPLRNVQALLRYDGRPITVRSDIGRVTGDPSFRWGWRPGHIYDIAGDELAPGESASFELGFTIDTFCPEPQADAAPCLELPSGGVYAIGVDANVTTGDVERDTGGTARTVLPWRIAGDDTEPVPVALLWPVTGTPDIAIGDSAAGSAGSAGTNDRGLATLLAVPSGAPVTWAVDPSAWTAEVAAAVRGNGELLVLPSALPDAGALSLVDPVLARSTAAASAERSRGFTPFPPGPGTENAYRMDASWPGGSRVSADALRAWASAGYDVVVLPGNVVAAPGRGPTATIDTGGNRITTVLTDPGLDSAIAGNAGPAAGPASALDLRQRWLAETAMAGAGPFGDERTALVAAPPVDWRPSADVAGALLEAWTATDWIEPVGLERLIPPTGTAPPAFFTPAGAATGGLPADYVRDVVNLHDELARYRSLVDEPDADPGPGIFSGSAEAVAARAASVTWRNDPDGARAEVAGLREEIAAGLDGVRVVVNPSNTLSGNTGVFPVNIANDLAQAVTVRLEFDPANEDRLAIEPVEAKVPGGRQQTVQVRAEAVANGEVPVSVQLATVDGEPLGGAQLTVVNATDYGTIGWFVVAGSAVLFAGGLSWRMLRGRRRTTA